MADIFDKHTKRILKSVDTSKYITDGEYYEEGRYIINPQFVPQCASKYIFIEVGDTLREMTQIEKDAADWVEPPPEPIPPTAEEVEKSRKRDIANGIAEKYTLADENALMRKLHTGESLLGDADIQDWLNWVATKKSEHPKV